MKCPKCGNYVPEHVAFCRYCGTDLKPEEDGRAKDKFCPKCGADTLADAAYCTKCGAALAEGSTPKTVKCPKCGADALSGASFCALCGAELKLAPAEKAEPPFKENPPAAEKTQQNTAAGETTNGGDYKSSLYMFTKAYKIEHEPRPGAGIFWLGFLAGLINAIVAVVAFIILKNDTPLKASRFGKGALFGFIVVLILYIIIFCCIF